MPCLGADLGHERQLTVVPASDLVGGHADRPVTTIDGVLLQGKVDELAVADDDPAADLAAELDVALHERRRPVRAGTLDRRREPAAIANARTSVTPRELSPSTGLTTAGGATLGISPAPTTSPHGTRTPAAATTALALPLWLPSALTSGGLPR
jgi:hypothetical protein